MVDAAVSPTGSHSGAWPFEAFRETVSQTFVPLVAEPGDTNTFRGAVNHSQLGSLLLAQVTAGPHLIRRNSRIIRQADPGCYKLTLQVMGRALLRQDDREAVLGPGDLALYDTTRPYELRFDGPFRMIVLMFSRSLLHVPETSVRLLTGQRIAGDHGLGLLIGPFVSGLLRRVDGSAAPADRRLCDAVLDMLAAAVLDELRAGATPNGPRQAALLQRIKDYIDDELADPDLGPAGVAAAHHISPRYLRKLFEGEGESAARWIRNRRLEQCRHDLARPELCDRSVSAVAARWGLTDAAHFSRLFRSAYGQSPREYRQSVLASAWSALPRTA
jgi:AraC-like DNA-binding protein